MPAAVAAVLAGAAPAARAEPPTFTRDVAPIVFRNCAPCHRPGEAGPFSLLTYDDARKRAAQIAAVTKSRYMPPWLPEPGLGLEGERRLTDAQIATLQAWVERGAPEGSPADLPPLPRFTEGWQLGPPDLVLEMPEPYTLPAEGTDVFRNFVIPVPGDETRSVRAVEVRPGDKRVVHHANLLVDRTRASRRLDAADAEVGFPGMDLRIESDVFDPDSHFLFWKPGTPPAPEPEGMAWTLPAGADLVLNAHLQPSGKPEAVRAAVGLYFADRAPTRRPMLVQLENDAALDIPPGARAFVVREELEIPLDVDVLAVYPHAHYLGRTLEAEARLPDGTRRPLVRIPEWNLDWQGVYRYREPPFLPRGSVVSMRYVYDNSGDNPRNPSRPPRRVVAGNRSSDEMAHLWLQVLPRGTEDGRPALQEAVNRHRLKKDPRDVAARFNLASVLLLQGRQDEARRELEEAVRLDPEHVVARNSLGTVYQEHRRYAEAIEQFREVLRRDPGRLEARFNLANCLGALGLFEEAAGHFRELVRADPADSGAQRHLAAALQEAGDRRAKAAEYEPAAALYAEAVDVEPASVDARNRLGTVLIALGRSAEAVAAFEAVLRLDPGNGIARESLELLKGPPR